MKRRRIRRLHFLLRLSVLLGVLLPAFSGCNPVDRHKALSLLFDGVPEMPPPQKYCETYFAELAEEQSQAALGGDEGSAGDNSSKHRPYAEKRCQDCHDKEQPGGLIAPARELCTICHTDFMREGHVHGPVAVGDCLACHLPHHSPNPSLLKKPNGALCSTCHQEKRLAEKMHDQVGEHKLSCTDCHAPHFGESRYFLQ